MASKYDWEFIKPLDQTANIAAMTYGNQQMLAGLQGMGTAVTGLADHYKQRNTDDILNTLMQAQTSQDLPNAMTAVQALQQQYGRGYDQTKVRDAIDTRGQVLNQRDMQALQYQQAQAQHDAMPMVNEAMAGLVNSRQGVSPEQQAMISQLAQAGYDTTGIMNTMGNLAVGDFRDNRTYTTGRSDRAEDVQWRKDQANQAQSNWNYDREFREDESNWNRGGQIAAENPGGSTLTYQDGQWATVTTPKVTRMDAYGALANVRGIRNNNPGNLGFAGQKGASRENGSGRFAAFNTPEEGLAAMSKQLDLYFTGKSKNVKGPAQTVQSIISAWAPPGENDTRAYVNQVSKALGVGPNDRINLNDPKVKTALMQEIVKKENGGNPYSPEQYNAGVTGRIGTASAASNAIQLPQATAAKVVNNYSAAITELNNKFNLQTSQDQAKTAMGSKGQTIDSWLTSKTTKDREGSTLLTNYSNKVAKLGRNNAKLSNLPMDDQLQILDAAHAWSLTSGGVITDKELNKQISSLATRVIDGKKNELEQGKKNIFESQYQAFVQEMNAAGMPAVDRNAFRQLVSPETAPKSSKATPKPSLASQASKAVAKSGTTDNPFHSEPAPRSAPAAAPTSPLSLQPRSGGQAFIPFANAGGPKPVPVPPKAPAAAPVLTKAQQNAQAREARKEIQRAAASQRYTESKKPKPQDSRSAIDKLTGGAKPLINNNRTLSAKELEEFMRKYKVQ